MRENVSVQDLTTDDSGKRAREEEEEEKEKKKEEGTQEETRERQACANCQEDCGDRSGTVG